MQWETKNYNLKYPIDFKVDGGEVIKVDSVTISLPKGRDMRKITRCANKVEADPLEYSEVDMIMDCTEIMSDMPSGAIEELHPADIQALGDIAGPFLEAVMVGEPPSEDSPDTGATTSVK